MGKDGFHFLMERSHFCFVVSVLLSVWQTPWHLSELSGTCQVKTENQGMLANV